MDLHGRKISKSSIERYNKDTGDAVQIFVNIMLWQILQFNTANCLPDLDDEINASVRDLKERLSNEVILKTEDLEKWGAEIVDE